MAIREILTYPNYRLRIKSAPVTYFDDDLKALVGDMAETMYDAAGIGLAAIQINVPKRVVVMDLSTTRDTLRVFINPQITKLEGVIETEEGCLSVPGVVATVERVKKVIIRAQDINGLPFELAADEILSVCIQHEVDHLDGKVLVDYLSRLKRERLRKKLLKEERLSKAEVA